jgi:hypothetical protein
MHTTVLDIHRCIFFILTLRYSTLLYSHSYTWGTDIEHGFHGVYLGDLERLQEIQQRRDATNRNWQRIVLYNIAKSLNGGGDSDSAEKHEACSTKEKNGKSPFPKSMSRKIVFETRQLWWNVHTKMQNPEYGNMLLLVRMKDELENRMYRRRQKYMTFGNYEELVNKLHLDAEGHVVEPFVAISERHDREERQRMYYDTLAQDLEEECLIK